MTKEKEQQWAKELKKAKQVVKEKHIPLSLHKKQTEEEMEYFRTKLMEAVSKNDWEETQKYYEKIISTRATQAVLQIKQEKSEKKSTNEEVTEKTIKHFFEDCIKLAISIDKIFEKK